MRTFKRLKPSNPKDSFQIKVALYNASTMRVKPYTKGIVLMSVISKTLAHPSYLTHQDIGPRIRGGAFCSHNEILSVTLSILSVMILGRQKKLD